MPGAARKAARAFSAESDPNKRERLIERLLTRDEFADFWALKWADLLKIEERVLDPQGMRVFHAWIRESISKNKPLDQSRRAEAPIRIPRPTGGARIAIRLRARKIRRACFSARN